MNIRNTRPGLFTFGNTRIMPGDNEVADEIAEAFRATPTGQAYEEEGWLEFDVKPKPAKGEKKAPEKPAEGAQAPAK